MVVITQELPDTPDASELVLELESHLATLYAQESRHGFSVQQLVRDGVAFFVARVNGAAAGCGGVLVVGSEYGELKRMYVRPQFRGQGIGKRLLEQLAEFSRQRGIQILRLETGIHQTEAIRLYEGFGFCRIPPFGPYRVDPVGLCYECRLG